MGIKNITKQELEPTSMRPKRKWLKRLGMGGVILFLTLVAALTILPAAFPAFGANMADFLRAVFGPEPVAKLESVSFKLHDEMSRLLYKDAKPQIAWDNSTQPESIPASETSQPTPSPTQEKPSLPDSNVSSSNNPPPPNDSSPSNDPALPTTTDVVTAAPQIGWQAYGPNLNGSPVLARALVSPDPHRPYAAVALVRMDLSQLELHVMPGYLEPAHPAELTQVIPHPGVIPTSDQSILVAAFNGGFKAAHGHYGMMVQGFTLLPPIPNMATVAIYRDGHVQMGVWGKDIVPSADMVAFRQNCPPLLEAGQLNPNVLVDSNQGGWGYTTNTDITWRTGIGITQDGRYLIYAVGNGTSVATMARVFQSAGAYSAMQLDINQYYAHFNAYQPVTGSAASQGSQLEVEPLLDKMTKVPDLYMRTPEVRDFFYLTPRVLSQTQ